MFNPGEFYTLKGYSLLGDKEPLTTAMEDYLEIIYRLYTGGEEIRIKKISEVLHVKPSSASKMAVTLKNSNYIEFEKYGQITLTDAGKTMGEYLLDRHNVLHQFFCRINHSDNELMLVEKIEHFIDRKTVENMRRWLNSSLF
ncbi:MAG: metal-dependent transcriptional regulator [Peptococcaceae bacterium]|nr:metal-dependent transcriptional regulator [Peptococcaceae bacterium]